MDIAKKPNTSIATRIAHFTKREPLSAKAYPVQTVEVRITSRNIQEVLDYEEATGEERTHTLMDANGVQMLQAMTTLTAQTLN